MLELPKTLSTPTIHEYSDRSARRQTIVNFEYAGAHRVAGETLLLR